MSDSFEITTGVRQGCLLSPFLFNLAIDWIMKETTRGRQNGIQWTPWLQLDDIDFANDVALLSHATRQMQDKSDDLDVTSKKLGLGIHTVKSKVMRNSRVADTGVSPNGNLLEFVDIFCYLGSMVDSTGGTEADIKARIGKARTAFTQLKKIWRSSVISRKTKMRLFNALVMTVLLYGCQTWKTTKGTIKKVQIFVNKCLRTILKIR